MHYKHKEKHKLTQYNFKVVMSELSKIKLEMVAEIRKGLKVIMIKDLATRMGFTVQNLNEHLRPNGKYTNNMEMLEKIAETLAQMIKEKNEAEKKRLDRIREKITSATNNQF